jgi:hypothetical protein
MLTGVEQQLAADVLGRRRRRISATTRKDASFAKSYEEDGGEHGRHGGSALRNAPHHQLLRNAPHHACVS